MGYQRFRYPIPGGYRYPKRYPKWYQIDRVQEGELLGTIIEQRVRCGKLNCKCASGKPGDLHGPYHYRIWRDEDGRQRKAYVKRSALADVQAAIDRRGWRLARERAERNRHMRRGMGHGKAAHEWARERREAQEQRQPDLLTRALRNMQALERLLR